MRPRDSPKSYINFFKSQLTKVSNCGKEVYALSFINRLQIAHPLYIYLMKHNITKMNEILTRAQPYIQLEEAMKASSNHTAKPGDGGGKLKSPHEALDRAQD